MVLPKINKKIIGVAVFAITFILFWPAINLNIPTVEQSKIDTSFSRLPVELKLIENKKISTPTAVKKYKPSIKARAKVEKSEIITSVKIYKPIFSNFKRLEVTKIDTLGLAIKNTYNLSDFKEVNIDHIGNVSIKKKRKFIIKCMYIAIPCVAASVLAKYSYDKWQKKH